MAWLPIDPLPRRFRLEPSIGQNRPIASLQHALRRHRLLFLWYAHAFHFDLAREKQPKKHELYRKLGLDGRDEHEALEPADAIFDYSEALEAWLRELHQQLGTGKGIPLREDRWPNTPFAQWEFDPSVPTPLADSEGVIARLTGAALRAPLPAWLDQDGVEAVQRCRHIARPPVVSMEFKAAWETLPHVQWDYPEQVQAQVEALDPLRLMEGDVSHATTANIAQDASPTSKQAGVDVKAGVPENMFKKEGRTWVIHFGGKTGHYPHKEGFQHLQKLLRSPAKQIDTAELQGLSAGSIKEDRQYDGRTYREIKTLLESGDLDLDERDEAENYLRKGKGLGGQPRPMPSKRDSARTAVRQSIQRAIEDIRSDWPELADYFTQTITYGRHCTYTPKPTDSSWEF